MTIETVFASPRQGKARENRVRRLAARQDLVLIKSRGRDPQAWDHGTYQLVETYMRLLALPSVAGGGYGYSLDEVEEALTST